MFRTTTRIPPIIHPKMNAGKEPFKCGMASAECGAGKSADYADCTDFFSPICVRRRQLNAVA